MILCQWFSLVSYPYIRIIYLMSLLLLLLDMQWVTLLSMTLTCQFVKTIFLMLKIINVHLLRRLLGVKFYSCPSVSPAFGFCLITYIPFKQTIWNLYKRSRTKQGRSSSIWRLYYFLPSGVMPFYFRWKWGGISILWTHSPISYNTIYRHDVTYLSFLHLHDISLTFCYIFLSHLNLITKMIYHIS